MLDHTASHQAQKLWKFKEEKIKIHVTRCVKTCHHLQGIAGSVQALFQPACPATEFAFARSFSPHFSHQTMPNLYDIFMFFPRHRLGAALLCGCLSLGLLGASGQASGVESDKTRRAASATAARPEIKQKGSVKIKHQRSTSEESTTERDRRLYRECKGRPNAGACLGYTHGRP